MCTQGRFEYMEPEVLNQYPEYVKVAVPVRKEGRSYYDIMFFRFFITAAQTISVGQFLDLWSRAALAHQDNIRLLFYEAAHGGRQLVMVPFEPPLSRKTFPSDGTLVGTCVCCCLLLLLLLLFVL